jgi:hypothetical protein
MTQVATPKTQAGLKKAFIAMSFDAEFDYLVEPIRSAVLQAGFYPSRVDWGPKAEDWLQEMFVRIHDADVIIAVCTPERQTRVPNANVMYELGFAHCLGTPAVIVTTDIDTLPSDLKTRDAITYSASEPKALKDKLCARIATGAKQRDEAPAKPTRDTDFVLSHSLPILSFVTRILQAFQKLDALEDLLQAVRNSPPDLEECGRIWRQYELQYRNGFEGFLQPCAQSRESVDKAFSNLEQVVGEASCSKARANYEALKKQALQHYPDQLQEVSQKVISGLAQQGGEFYGKLSHLLQMTKQITGIAGDLIHELTRLMTSDPRRKG